MISVCESRQMDQTFPSVLSGLLLAPFSYNLLGLVYARPAYLLKQLLILSYEPDLFIPSIFLIVVLVFSYSPIPSQPQSFFVDGEQSRTMLWAAVLRQRIGLYFLSNSLSLELATSLEVDGFF